MELRYNPLLDWWLMFSAQREKRPLMPRGWCPFCPGSGKVPENYDVYLYHNDFPILRLDAPTVSPDLLKIDTVDQDMKRKFQKLYKAQSSFGICDVVLYTPEHNGKIYELSFDHMMKLINLWSKRFSELQEEEKVKYVYIFENRGEAVGVTMPHPHGQIYGYPFIPKKIEAELATSKKYFREEKNCLYCDMMQIETLIQKRVVYENNSFFVFVPYFAEYPYQVFIYLKSHKQNILQLSQKEKENFIDVLQLVVKMYDAIFNMTFPYMMAFHQAPVDDGNYEHYHFHIEFYPPLRNKETQKFNASSETGAWVHGNPASPEKKAEEMRNVIKKLGGQNE